jgi:hypothetical protein
MSAIEGALDGLSAMFELGGEDDGRSPGKPGDPRDARDLRPRVDLHGHGLDFTSDAILKDDREREPAIDRGLLLREQFSGSCRMARHQRRLPGIEDKHTVTHVGLPFGVKVSSTRFAISTSGGHFDRPSRCLTRQLQSYRLEKHP